MDYKLYASATNKKAGFGPAFCYSECSLLHHRQRLVGGDIFHHHTTILLSAVGVLIAGDGLAFTKAFHFPLFRIQIGFQKGFHRLCPLPGQGIVVDFRSNGIGMTLNNNAAVFQVTLLGSGNQLLQFAPRFFGELRRIEFKMLSIDLIYWHWHWLCFSHFVFTLGGG